MITARKSAAFQKLFALYNRNLMRRRFHGLRVRGLDVLTGRRRGDGPLVIYCNHSSWWDGLVAFHVSHVCALDSYAMMEERSLRAHGFHRRLGAFSVVRDDAREALHSINYAAELLRGSDRVLWIFPQGQTTPSEARPLKFFSGAARIIQRLDAVDAVPLAMRYEFLDDFRPEIFLRVGAPQKITAGHSGNAKQLTAELAVSLTQTLDDLRGDVVTRDFALYEELLAPRRPQRQARKNS